MCLWKSWRGIWTLLIPNIINIWVLLYTQPINRSTQKERWKNKARPTGLFLSKPHACGMCVCVWGEGGCSSHTKWLFELEGKVKKKTIRNKFGPINKFAVTPICCPPIRAQWSDLNVPFFTVFARLRCGGIMVKKLECKGLKKKMFLTKE